MKAAKEMPAPVTGPSEENLPPLGGMAIAAGASLLFWAALVILVL